MEACGQHLTYCTNIHSGESWAAHFASLKAHLPAVKAGISRDALMGVGLRLSNQASLDLLVPGQLEEFSAWLNVNNLYVFTMNGFPYGDFHEVRVKDQVHYPDWTTQFRLDYTLRLAGILKILLPPGIEGGISTSPLSYKYWFTSEESRTEARRLATLNVLKVAEHLALIVLEGGPVIHLDLEPEPDGSLETGMEFIDWYEAELLPVGGSLLADSLNISESTAVEVLREHICLCYDICHFAIGFEDHAAMIELLAAKKIKIGKLQISAALSAVIPGSSIGRQEICNLLATYNEPVYLHQVVARSAAGNLTRYRDLPPALEQLSGNVPVADDQSSGSVKPDENLSGYTLTSAGASDHESGSGYTLTSAGASDHESGSGSPAEEWRIHFHVPLFCTDLSASGGASLKSTQADIIQVLKIQREKPFTSHLEVETYTWEVLPDALKLPLGQSIIRELAWVKEQLKFK